MTTLGMDGVADIHQPLFRNADHGTGAFDTGECVFYHATAFIHDQCWADALTFKIGDNVSRTVAVDLFVSGKCKVNIIFPTNLTQILLSFNVK